MSELYIDNLGKIREYIIPYTFELQCLCFYGFYIKKDSLILFMTGGKIILGMIIRVSGKEMILITTTFMSKNIMSSQGTTSMVPIITEGAITMNEDITILVETLIIITMLIMFTRKSTSIGEVSV